MVFLFVLTLQTYILNFWTITRYAQLMQSSKWLFVRQYPISHKMLKMTTAPYDENLWYFNYVEELIWSIHTFVLFIPSSVFWSSKTWLISRRFSSSSSAFTSVSRSNNKLQPCRKKTYTSMVSNEKMHDKITSCTEGNWAITFMFFAFCYIK